MLGSVLQLGLQTSMGSPTLCNYLPTHFESHRVCTLHLLSGGFQLPLSALPWRDVLIYINTFHWRAQFGVLLPSYKDLELPFSTRAPHLNLRAWEVMWVTVSAHQRTTTCTYSSCCPLSSPRRGSATHTSFQNWRTLFWYSKDDVCKMLRQAITTEFFKSNILEDTEVLKC